MQHNRIIKLSKFALVSSFFSMVSVSQVSASGFAVPELSVSGLALSNALVANAKDLGAIPYNPAAMAFHEGNSFSAGVILVKPELSVDTGSGTIDSDADDVVAIPLFSAHHTMSEEWSIGLSINAPFGLETDWPLGTFDSQYPAGAAIPTKSKLELLAISPSVANRLSENLSLAVGLDYYWLKNVDFNSAFNLPGTPKFDLSGDGRGVGVNLGALYQMDSWSVGVSYHSTANINIEGEIKTPVSLPVPSNDATADLELPWRLQVGVRNQTTEKLAIEFDITRTGWSSFEVLEVKNEDWGVNVFTSENHWDDANAYRIGISYDLNNATQLRAGYTFDETPQDDDYFSARIPDSDRHLFSVGLGHKMANGWAIDAGYMYVRFEDRSLDQDASDYHADNPTEFNGTPAINGDYESTVHLFGLGVSKTFM